MKETRDREGGMVIVEASIVIFLMLFAGNAYLQKCRVDSYVTQLALDGAAYCADPMVRNVINNSIPKVADSNVYPYRAFDPNGVGDVKGEMQTEVETKMNNLSTGLFSGMKPKDIKTNADYENDIIYGKFTVSVQYKIVLPVRLLGATENISMSLSSHSSVPVSDTAEFIRNIDMAEDYMEKFGIMDKIDDIKDKLGELFGKVKAWFKD